MRSLFNRDDAPGHLFKIPELDFSQELLVDPLRPSWFRLGAWTVNAKRDEQNVEDVVSRQSLLLSPAAFSQLFDELESIGNAIGHLGKPGGSVTYHDDIEEYRYAPFHRFEFPFSSITAEPLVFVNSTGADTHLFINPDLPLFFELQEKKAGSGTWWDQGRAVEALRRSSVERNNLEIVEIRTDYLLKYLQARQMALLVGHYRHLQLFEPAPEKVHMYEEGELTPGYGVGAVLLFDTAVQPA